MLSGKDADGFSAIALAIFTRRSVRRRSPNSAVPNVSTAHLSGCSSPAMSICLTPFVYIVSPSSLPEFVLTCQSQLEGESIELGSIITQQKARDRVGALGSINRNSQSLLDALAQIDPKFGQ